MAAAGLGVVEIEGQVIATQEPLESEPGFLEPERIVGGVVGLDAGRHGGEGLKGLLVEVGAVAAAVIEAARADGAEAAGWGLLLFDQPGERLETERQGALISAGAGA